MTRFLLIAGITLVLATLIACSSGDETGSPIGTGADAQPQHGGILRIAQPGDPISCDLAMSRGAGYQSVHPCNPMLSQIVRISPADHGQLLPDLATSWDLAPDGLTWTFKLRDDAGWHDGSPVTADDLKFSLDRVIETPAGLAPGRAGPIATYISSTEQITAPDEQTLVVRTDFPAASFLANLASVYVSVYPRDATERLDPPSMVRHEQVIGSGPFKFESAVRGSAYRMVRNDSYYQPDLPYLDGVTYLVMPSPAVRLAALETHEVDILMLLFEPQALELEEKFANRITVIREPQAGGNTVQMNLRAAPFDDPSVRRAVNLAFDRGQARLALGGGFDGAIMPPGGPWTLARVEIVGLPGYGDTETERAEARRLLTAAGYPDGLDVKMHVRSDPFSLSLAEFAADQLSKVGIQAEILPLERVAYQDMLSRREYAIIAHSHSFPLDDPDSILPAHYACGGSENFPGLCDPRLDELIRAQSRELNPSARKQLVDEIQRLAWDADAKVWFNWSVRRTPVWNNVKNFRPGGPSLYQGRRLETVWLE